MNNQYLRNGMLTCLLCAVVALSGCASTQDTSQNTGEKSGINWTFWKSDADSDDMKASNKDGKITIGGENLEEDTMGTQNADGSTTLTAEDQSNIQIQPKECPDVAVLDELNSLYDFSDFSDPVPANSISTVWITGLDIKCKVTSEQTELFIDLIFEAHLGPKAEFKDGEEKTLEAPYFVALTDARGNIVAKKLHGIDMKFKSRDDYLIDKQTITKSLTKDEILGYGGFEVLIGFQLSEDQLNYNRQAKINAGAFQ